jgi:cytochrome P450
VLTQTTKIPHILLNMDPPEHTRMRKLVARAFTTPAVERLRPRVQQISDHLVDTMIALGPPVDFVAAFATPLPALVISELLGVPGEDRDRLGTWLDLTLSVSGHTPEEIRHAFEQLLAYLERLVAAKRAAPADDLVSGLIAARDRQDRLSEPELMYTVFILIAGGYQTTAGLLTNALLVLHRHPDQLALLRDRPELIPGAVDELLRHVPISWAALERVTLEDVQLSGVDVPAGSTVIPVTSAANRDPLLVDEPDRLDVTRTSVPHLAFGHGVHHCLGATLARVELRTAFTTLLCRLPQLRPALPESALYWKTGMLTIGPLRLPVVWGDAA